MWIYIETHVLWALLCLSLVVIALLATIYCFSRRQSFEDGPRKGEAANPAKVRRQHSMNR